MNASRLITGAAAMLLLTGVLAGCAGEPGDSPSNTAPSPSESASSAASATPSATPTPTSTPVALPKDCKEILSEDVLAQLADVPLNDPSLGTSGVQADGSLLCIWRDPAADTTGLVTEISGMNRGPALDMLNALVEDEAFTCFTPDDGTRCEKTWENALYPVTDGRTLYWRDDVLIDTTYSNLAPSGYTASIVASLFD
ncbi:hypothetical protein [Microbacterium sp. A84]|uniref:hypothetical protein n=1 Tax=Microbacterium sp. A84 TaxID=3450715 RepID=UPI003F440403